MARFLPSDTGLIYETEVSDETKNSKYPPSTKAVFDALGGVKDTVFEKILMSANDTTYEVTIDEEGALKVTEVTD